MKLRPRHKGVIIEIDEKEQDQKTEGGIYLPQTQWSMHPDVLSGIVLSIGTGCQELKEGMKVIVGRFAGVKIDEGQMLVDEEDIIAEVME